MGLVGYSDSEGSDNEDVKPQSSKPAASTGTSASTQKTRTDKVVSGNKIRVNLPGMTATAPATADEAENIDADRPAKRARTSGASSGINSFLPAPKNPAKAGGGSGSGSSGTGLLSRSRGTGLSKGISLKTGATPAFSRDLPEPSDSTYEERDADARYDEFGGQSTNVTTSIPLTAEDTQAQEAIPARKPMMFKPLSVGKKPKKKSSSAVAAKGPIAVPSDAAKPALNTVAPPKKKSLLFSGVEHESTTVPNTQEYQPEFTAPEEVDRAYDEDPDDQLYSETYAPDSSAAPPQQPQSQTNDLQSLASTLNLTKEQRRQLFGRDGTNNAKLASFNLAQEYSSNNALMQDEASQAPLHNPVRAIAPGKHSLQQLLNSAQNQKEALEESFARGKANKAAAGTKYGW
jgi:hypothetical protein